MAVVTLARKDLRLLARDPRAVVVLLGMPLVFILVLGLALGDTFGQKPDDRLRISVVNRDLGLPPNPGPFPDKPWSEVVIDDLAASDLRIELIESVEEAESLVRRGERPAVLIFEPDFSARVHACSFLSEIDPPPVNPFFRDGVSLAELRATLLRDPGQPVAASVIDQVAQVTLMRVVMPWMIGKAFDRVGDSRFMESLADKLKTDGSVPPEVLRDLRPVVDKMLGKLFADERFLGEMGKDVPLTRLLPTDQKREMTRQFLALINRVFRDEAFLKAMAEPVTFDEMLTPGVRSQVGPAVRRSIGDLFDRYDLTAKTWGQLTRQGPRPVSEGNRSIYAGDDGVGFLKRGAIRYQILVPANTVMFAFFLVLVMGWLFVAERRQGTLIRLRAAPIARWQVLFGKLLPCLAVSLAQGFVLLLAGKVVFGMSWGTAPVWLAAVVVSTSTAAVGLAMLVASLARTETQVAIYGTLLVLVLAGISGCLMPRDLMPEEMRQLSRVTPHAWALDAYTQLLVNPAPDLGVVAQACAVLFGFGMMFLIISWGLLRLE